jgi:hypothetical protein
MPNKIDDPHEYCCDLAQALLAFMTPKRLSN